MDHLLLGSGSVMPSPCVRWGCLPASLVSDLSYLPLLSRNRVTPTVKEPNGPQRGCVTTSRMPDSPERARGGKQPHNKEQTPALPSIYRRDPDTGIPALCFLCFH